MPLLGLLQAVRFCEDGNKYINCDTVIDFANREFSPEQKTIPLIDHTSNKLCGVSVDL